MAHILLPENGRAECDWGLYSGLPDPIQTVLRSELFALLWVLRRADRGLSIDIVSDSKVTCSIYHARDAEQVEERDGDHILHHDLWYALQLGGAGGYQIVSLYTQCFSCFSQL